jgi:hypothetical protein
MVGFGDHSDRLARRTRVRHGSQVINYDFESLENRLGLVKEHPVVAAIQEKIYWLDEEHEQKRVTHFNHMNEAWLKWEEDHKIRHELESSFKNGEISKQQYWWLKENGTYVWYTYGGQGKNPNNHVDIPHDDIDFDKQMEEVEHVLNSEIEYEEFDQYRLRVFCQIIGILVVLPVWWFFQMLFLIGTVVYQALHWCWFAMTFLAFKADGRIDQNLQFRVVYQCYLAFLGHVGVLFSEMRKYTRFILTLCICGMITPASAASPIEYNLIVYDIFEFLKYSFWAAFFLWIVYKSARNLGVILSQISGLSLYLVMSVQFTPVKADDITRGDSTQVFYITACVMGLFIGSVLIFLLYQMTSQMQEARKESSETMIGMKTTLTDVSTTVSTSVEKLTKAQDSAKENFTLMKQEVVNIAQTAIDPIVKKFVQVEKNVSDIKPAIVDTAVQIGHTAKTIDTVVATTGWVALFAFFFYRLYRFFTTSERRLESRTFLEKTVNVFNLVVGIPMMAYSGFKAARSVLSWMGSSAGLVASCGSGLRTLLEGLGIPIPVWFEKTLSIVDVNDRRYCEACQKDGRNVGAPNTFIDKQGISHMYCKQHYMGVLNTAKCEEVEDTGNACSYVIGKKTCGIKSTKNFYFKSAWWCEEHFNVVSGRIEAAEDECNHFITFVSSASCSSTSSSSSAVVASTSSSSSLLAPVVGRLSVSTDAELLAASRRGELPLTPNAPYVQCKPKDAKNQCKWNDQCALQDGSHDTAHQIECQIMKKQRMIAWCTSQISEAEKSKDVTRRNVYATMQSNYQKEINALRNPQDVTLQQVVSKVVSVLDQKDAKAITEEEAHKLTQEYIDELKKTGFSDVVESIHNFCGDHKVPVIVIGAVFMAFAIALGYYFLRANPIPDDRKEEGRKSAKKKLGNRGQKRHDKVKEHLRENNNRFYKGFYSKGFDINPYTVLEFSIGNGAWRVVDGSSLQEKRDYLLQLAQENDPASIRLARDGNHRALFDIQREHDEFGAPIDYYSDVEGDQPDIKEDYRTEREREQDEKQEIYDAEMEEHKQYVEDDEFNERERLYREQKEDERVANLSRYVNLPRTRRHRPEAACDDLKKLQDETSFLKTSVAQTKQLLENEIKKKEALEAQLKADKALAELNYQKRLAALEERYVAKIESNKKLILEITDKNVGLMKELEEHKAAVPKVAMLAQNEKQVLEKQLLEEKEKQLKIESSVVEKSSVRNEARIKPPIAHKSVVVNGETVIQSVPIVTKILKRDADKSVDWKASDYPCRDKTHTLEHHGACMLDHSGKIDKKIYSQRNRMPCINVFNFGECANRKTCLFNHGISHELASVLFGQRDCPDERKGKKCVRMSCPFKHTLLATKPFVPVKKAPIDRKEQAVIADSPKVDLNVVLPSTARVTTDDGKVFANCVYIGGERFAVVKHAVRDVYNLSQLSGLYILWNQKKLRIQKVASGTKDEAFKIINVKGRDLVLVSVDFPDVERPPVAHIVPFVQGYVHLYAFRNMKDLYPLYSGSTGVGAYYSEDGTVAYYATSMDGDCSAGIWQVQNDVTKLVGLHQWGSEAQKENGFIPVTSDMIQRAIQEKEIYYPGLDPVKNL